MDGCKGGKEESVARKGPKEGREGGRVARRMGR